MIIGMMAWEIGYAGSVCLELATGNCTERDILESRDMLAKLIA
ncbi:MAG: hypothetical protein WCP21_14820 [Armatimonadota bacterium]